MAINSLYADNYYALEDIKRFFASVDIADIDSICIIGSSSPEGSFSTNMSLGIKRAESMRNFLRTKFFVPPSKMYVSAGAGTWSEMLSLIEKDAIFPDKDHSLLILNNNAGTPLDRISSLKLIGYGQSYYYLKDVIFSKMRSSSAFVVYYRSKNRFEESSNKSTIAPFVFAPPAPPSRALGNQKTSSSTYVPKSVIGVNHSYNARFTILYPFNGVIVDSIYANNAYTIEEMRRFFNTIDMSKIDSISVVGSCSPEEGGSFNSAVAKTRAEDMRSFLKSEYNVPFSLTFMSSRVDTWPDLIRMINKDPNFPDKENTLNILNSNVEYLNKLQRIKYLIDEQSYQYINNTILPKLRSSTAFIFYYSSDKPFISESATSDDDVSPLVIEPRDSLANVSDSTKLISTPVLSAANSWKPGKVQKPLFALKTNLLYDAATLVNLSLEVPIGNNWSIGVEALFPWWLDESRQNCLQVYNGNLEVKYWFKPRTNQPRGQFSTMTGWFAGIYGGVGLYDIEYSGRGYQGEFLFSAGLMGGYSHSIGKSLRIEYSLGVGYMETKYRSYQANYSTTDNEWYLYRREAGRFSWIGPTHAKISLVWMLSRNVKN